MLTKDLDGSSEEDYIKTLSGRLERFLGNLVGVHEGLERGEEIQPETIEARFTVVCWLDPNKQERYGILDCTEVA